MKTLLILFASAVLLLSANTAFAQSDKKGNKAPGAEKVEEMSKVLSLTDEQKTKVLTIYKESATKKKAAKARHKAELKKIKTDRRQQVDAVLTEEQKTKWKAHKEAKDAKKKKK